MFQNAIPSFSPNVSFTFEYGQEDPPIRLCISKSLVISGLVERRIKRKRRFRSRDGYIDESYAVRLRWL